MISFAVYCLVAIVNLVSAAFFKETIRKLSKACLMPALVVCYLLGPQHILIWVIAALIASWIGDILLINKDNPAFFKLGLAAFLISHALYIVAFLTLAGSLNVFALIISVILAIPLTLAILKLVNANASMKIPVTAYAVVIVLMSVSALQLMLVRPGHASVIVFIASLIYIFSDSLMAYLLFHNKPKYFNVITMAPYIIAQGAIILGLTLM
ncbi:MAG: lysoplasmalogenase [Propionibacteriaceae bacterium]|nr:lysoplasmalogenase [Propionibacteriaceae bacterium]